MTFIFWACLKKSKSWGGPPSNDKSNPQKQNKNGSGELNQLNEMNFSQTHNHEKCYCCGSGTHILNKCEIKYTIARDHWFDRTFDVQINHKQ